MGGISASGVLKYVPKILLVALHGPVVFLQPLQWLMDARFGFRGCLQGVRSPVLNGPALPKEARLENSLPFRVLSVKMESQYEADH